MNNGKTSIQTQHALLSNAATNIITEKRNGNNSDEFVNHVYELPNWNK
jgi:hypothetical protein